MVPSTYRQTSGCLLQISAPLWAEEGRGRVMWTPSSRSHRASPSAWGGAPGRGCTLGHGAGKHPSGPSAGLTVATALVPARQAGRQGLEVPPNLGKVEAGRHLWGPSAPTPLGSSRAARSQLPRTVAQSFWNSSEEGVSTASLGNLCQRSVALTVKKCFLTYRRNLPCFSACPWRGLCSRHWAPTTGKSPALSSLHPPVRF